MSVNRRNERFWPLTPTGTVALFLCAVPLFYGTNYAFWWFVKHAGDAALMLWALK